MPHAVFPTAFGDCGVAWNESGLTAFLLPEADAALTARRLVEGGHAPAAEPPDGVARVIARVQAHLAGTLQDFSDTMLDWSRVGEFQRAVYLQTQAIPPGATRSYGDIARALALGPDAARAVGAALGTNLWPLIVPCHRVVAADGKMTGFSAPGGVRTKTRLLALEGAELLSE
jgi:methylated-DNA-[protein]-cysteine S-methyltransferase